MKFEENRYLKFNACVAQIVENVRKKLSKTKNAEMIGKVLFTITNILLLGGLYIFSAFYALLMAGMAAYYGGIVALFTAHPVLATVMVTIAGMVGIGLFRLTRLLFDQREIFTAVKNSLIEKFKPEFSSLLQKNNPTKSNISANHIKEVEGLIKRGELSMLTDLIKRTKMKPVDFLKGAIPPQIRKLFMDEPF